MAGREQKPNPLPRTAYSVAEVAESLGLSDWAVRDLLNKGHLPSVQIGTRRLIPRAGFEAWVASLNQSQTA